MPRTIRACRRWMSTLRARSAHPTDRGRAGGAAQVRGAGGPPSHRRRHRLAHQRHCEQSAPYRLCIGSTIRAIRITRDVQNRPGLEGRAWSRRSSCTAETAHEQPRWCTEIWCGCRQLCRHVSDERTTLAVRSDSMASPANSTASSSGGGVGESPQLSSPSVARQTRHLVEHRVERQRSVESIVPIRPHLQHPEP
jgi:hypothetical protein